MTHCPKCGLNLKHFGLQHECKPKPKPERVDKKP
jgi:hypothetical protein